MIVTLDQLLTAGVLAAARDAKRAQRKFKRSGVRPVPLTAEARADALAPGAVLPLRRQGARQVAGRHRKGRR